MTDGLRWFVEIEGEEERELSPAEAMKFWLPPDDARRWMLRARYVDG